MKVRPSVVFGLGSTGAYVISDVERLLYELLGGTQLDFLKLIAIDTDNTRKEDEPPPGGYRRQNLPIYEQNLGMAMRGLRDSLGDDFTWCGTGEVNIPGAGAGNLRAGGRLMLFNKLPQVWQTIRSATHDVEQAARQPQTEARLIAELSGRNIPTPPGLVDLTSSVVFVVGTLAGGTGSGSCVDFGYMIRDAAPRSVRVGIFFVPDRTAPVVFQENTWAALKDLSYFCDHPSAFRKVVWPEANRSRHRYGGEDGAPYDLVYLISQADEQRAHSLPYEARAGSPLVMLAALKVTANILGLFEHRDRVLSNLNAQIQGDRQHYMYLNFNLRAICYPKYEISEAGTCKVIAEQICSLWLSTESYRTPTGVSRIRQEDWTDAGREYWNTRFGSIWRGAQSAVDISAWTSKLVSNDVPEPNATLRHEFAGNVQGTIYSKVAQQLPSRLAEIQALVMQGVVDILQSTHNISCAERFVSGFRQEIKYALEYWTRLDIPPGQDDSAWQEHVKHRVEQLLSGVSTPVKLLNAKRDYLRDELQELLNRLGMYLFRKTLRDFSDWTERHVVSWLEQLRRTVQTMQGLAENRTRSLQGALRNTRPPVLRLTRSSNVTFDQEIDELASHPPSGDIAYLSINSQGQMEGLFAVQAGQEASADEALFLRLKCQLQPEYLRLIERKGRVDIVQEISAQGRVPQAVGAARDCHAMSIATGFPLVKDPTAVPSFICARDSDTAQRLLSMLRSEYPGLPAMIPTALPVFDHMAIFYQEGAMLDPSRLSDAQSFSEHYERARGDRNRRTELLDPLAQIKEQGDAERGGAA